MKKSEFDDYAQDYDKMHHQNIKITGESTDYFAKYKILEVSKYYSGNLHKNLRILDYGSGIGNSLKYFLEIFPSAEIYAADVSKKSLEISKEKYANRIKYIPLLDKTIPIEDNYFNIVFVSCVFHHIPIHAQTDIMAELYRVLKFTGKIFIFEHNPYNPLTVRAVNTCPFDKDAVLLKAGKLKNIMQGALFQGPKINYTLFFPHCLHYLRFLEKYLYKLPLGGQYYIVSEK